MSSEDDLDDLDDLEDLSDDVSEGTLIMPPRRFLGLVSYLDLLRDAAFTPAQIWVGRPPKLTMVMGNPSADLDSMVSAVVFSYFHNSGVRGGSPMYGVHKEFEREDPSRKLFLSLINMPRTSSQTDLQRLRPELGVALREAFKVGLRAGRKPDDSDLKWAMKTPKKVEQFMCKSLLTIHDLIGDRWTFENFNIRFQEQKGNARSAKDKQQLMLVDHNAPSIPALSSKHISTQFSVTGCIDHHIDDDYVSHSPSVKPRIIQTGVGSCTSLVVKYLRDSGEWPDITQQQQDEKATLEDLDEDDVLALRQISTLALAPILIDTTNLRASGEKCSDVDREVVAFLETQINPSSTTSTTAQSQWSRDKFYDEISEAKANALDLLSMNEIFDHDFKQWQEGISLGISSIVKPISWLIEKPCKDQPINFIEALKDFANNDIRRLDVLVFSTRGVKDKAKELGAFAFTKEGVKAIEVFEKKAQQVLDLEEWDGDDKLREHFRKDPQTIKSKLWWMKDVTKTRKQIAPLMRDAVKSIA